MPACIAAPISVAVQLLEADDGVGILRPDPIRGLVALVEVAHREHDVGALVSKYRRGVEAEAGVGARHDGEPAGLIGHVGRGPLAAHGLNILSRCWLASAVVSLAWR